MVERQVGGWRGWNEWVGNSRVRCIWFERETEVGEVEKLGGNHACLAEIEKQKHM